MCIAAPKELGSDPLQCLPLRRCGYGIRDAGQTFEFVVRDDLEVHNFSQGTHSQCVCRHRTRRLWYIVHGDDVGLGAEVDFDGYRQQVSKRFILKLRGCLGLAAYH